VEHAYKLDVPAARVAELVGEEGSGIYVVDPHPVASEPWLGHDALYGAARYEIFLDKAAVQLGEGVPFGELAYVRAGIHGRFGAAGAVSAYYVFYELAYQVVGDGSFAGEAYQAVFAHEPSLGIFHDVAPLVAVGEALVALAPCSEAGSGKPRSVCGVNHWFSVFLL
jgi:hypothetical protein